MTEYIQEQRQNVQSNILSRRDKMTSGNLKKVRAAHVNDHIHTTSTSN